MGAFFHFIGAYLKEIFLALLLLIQTKRIFHKTFHRINIYVSWQVRSKFKKTYNKRQVLNQALDWLWHSNQAVGGKGVSLGYNVGSGWQDAHPEVSGYVLSTLRMLAVSQERDNPDISKKCETISRSTMDWFLKELYVPGEGYAGWKGEGAAYGGLVFDTGQILHGFLSVLEWRPQFCDRDKIKAVADWLADGISDKGTWDQGTFWGGEALEYYLRVTWALARASKILKEDRYYEKAKESFNYFLSRLSQNAWDGYLLVRSAENPYLYMLHFYAYTVQAVIECGLIFKNQFALRLADRALRTLKKEMQFHGALPGAIDRYGRGDYSFRCPIGEFQIATCCYRYAMFRYSDEYIELGDLVARKALNGFAKHFKKNTPYCGGVWGSLPIYGKYHPWTMISWGEKFLIDMILISDQHNNGLRSLIENGELA